VISFTGGTALPPADEVGWPAQPGAASCDVPSWPTGRCTRRIGCGRRPGADEVVAQHGEYATQVGDHAIADSVA
jgi:hypothetical protein